MNILKAFIISISLHLAISVSFQLSSFLINTKDNYQPQKLNNLKVISIQINTSLKSNKKSSLPISNYDNFKNLNKDNPTQHQASQATLFNNATMNFKKGVEQSNNFQNYENSKAALDLTQLKFYLESKIHEEVKTPEDTLTFKIKLSFKPNTIEIHIESNELSAIEKIKIISLLKNFDGMKDIKNYLLANNFPWEITIPIQINLK